MFEISNVNQVKQSVILFILSNEMSNYEFEKFIYLDYIMINHKYKHKLKGCRGKIAGCTNYGVYFIRRDKCDIESDEMHSPINLFLPEEFELAE